MTARGRFITLEGIDGAGKSTHVASIVAALQARGVRVVATREPGGTPLGEKMRELLLHEPMHPETEALLMFAARREHIAQVIQPALERGDWVVCDRFTDATYAYQGAGRAIGAGRIDTLARWVHPDLDPDVTFLFDVGTAEARRRLERSNEHPDRFEREAQQFFTVVRDAYLARAAADPKRVRVVDTSRPLADVRDEVASIVARID